MDNLRANRGRKVNDGGGGACPHPGFGWGEGTVVLVRLPFGRIVGVSILFREKQMKLAYFNWNFLKFVGGLAP